MSPSPDLRTLFAAESSGTGAGSWTATSSSAPAVLEKAAQADPGEDRDLLVVHSLKEGPPDERPTIQTADDSRTITAFGGDAGGRAVSFAGMGLCSGETLARLAVAFTKRGSVRLDADVMEETFDPARTVAFDAGPDFCETVASKASAQRAERYLIGTARKPTDGFFSRHFNRYISTFLTRQLLKINVSPYGDQCRRALRRASERLA